MQAFDARISLVMLFLQVLPLILPYLPISDILSLNLVCKSAHAIVSDPALWTSLLSQLTTTSKKIPKSSLPSMAHLLENPLTCLDYYSNKKPRLQVLMIYKSIDKYYTDLVNCSDYHNLLILNHFYTPQDQLKMLRNLQKYSKINYTTRSLSNDKLLNLMEIFENTLLREIEIQYDLKNYSKLNSLAQLLVSMDSTETLIEFYLQKCIYDVEIESIDSLISLLNTQSSFIDTYFPIPIMHKVSEELISNNLLRWINTTTHSVPDLYKDLTKIPNKLLPSMNIGPSYPTLVSELIDMMFESIAREYLRDQVIKMRAHFTTTQGFDIPSIQEMITSTTTCLSRLSIFSSYSILSLQEDLDQATSDIITSLIDSIINHLKPALTATNNNSLDFFQSVNTADSIIQMLHTFTNHHHLKRLEALVDKSIADGLNLSIEVLVNKLDVEIDYSTPGFGTSPQALTATALLAQHLDTLNADKSIVNIFQQELAERFFQLVVKQIKSTQVSVEAAPRLISDLNLYYDFFSQRPNRSQTVPLFSSLKNIGNLFLISGTDSKAIAKLASDLSKFNGIFNQEEIYEFVQRRSDWNLVKKDVEKQMYGFIECSIV